MDAAIQVKYHARHVKKMTSPASGVTAVTAFLKKASYDGSSKYVFSAEAELAETDLGTIAMAKVVGNDYPWVLKTIDLQRQNMYAMTRGLSPKKKTLRGTEASNVVFVSQSKRECTKWANTFRQRGLRLAKIAWLTKKQVSRDGAHTLLLCNEYINEAAIGTLMSRLPVPHFVKTHDAWIEDGTGHILMDYGGQSLTRSMVDFSIQEMKSVVLQVLVTLAIAQNLVSFKHHDVHLDNVFVNRMREGRKENEFQGSYLGSKRYWAYKISQDCTIYVEHCGILAKLGDFGLASATEPTSGQRLERVDYPQLDAGEVEWGAWNGRMEDCKSYDVVTFLTKFFLEDEIAYVPNNACLAWIQGLFFGLQKQELDQNKGYITASLIGRPLRGQEGNVSPTDFLRSSVFADFRVCPEPENVMYIYGQ